MPTSTRSPMVQPCSMAFMTDRDILADQQRIAAGVAGTLAGQVQHCAVLNVAARTDADMVDVPWRPPWARYWHRHPAGYPTRVAQGSTYTRLPVAGHFPL